MASVDRDEVDFSKLEQEVLVAMESEARYSRENDAKFRAVNQKVATYEEFRDIVLASHLKPLTKTDKMPEVFVQPWNTAFTKLGGTPDATKVPATISNAQPNKIPTSSLGLVNDWRRLKDDKTKLKYLLDIGGERLKHIFKTEISGGLLGDILQVLLGHSPECATEVASILDAISAAKRFKLDLQFMCSVEKETCQKLFSKLSVEACQGRDGTVVDSPTTDEPDKLQTGRYKPAPLEQDIKRLMALFQVTL